MCVDGEVWEELGDVGGSDDRHCALLQQLNMGGGRRRRKWGMGGRVRCACEVDVWVREYTLQRDAYG